MMCTNNIFSPKVYHSCQDDVKEEYSSEAKEEKLTAEASIEASLASKQSEKSSRRVMDDIVEYLCFTASASNAMRILFVGDACTGKSCMLDAFTQGVFPKESLRTVTYVLLLESTDRGGSINIHFCTTVKRP